MLEESESWKGEDPREPRRTFDDQLRDLLRRQPFEPFVITMTSGTSFRVDDPFLLALGSTTFTLYHRGGVAWLRKSEIAHIEIPEPAA